MPLLAPNAGDFSGLAVEPGVDVEAGGVGVRLDFEVFGLDLSIAADLPLGVAFEEEVGLFLGLFEGAAEGVAREGALVGIEGVGKADGVAVRAIGIEGLNEIAGLGDDIAEALGEGFEGGLDGGDGIAALLEVGSVGARRFGDVGEHGICGGEDGLDLRVEFGFEFFERAGDVGAGRYGWLSGARVA